MVLARKEAKASRDLWTSAWIWTADVLSAVEEVVKSYFSVVTFQVLMLVSGFFFSPTIFFFCFLKDLIQLG